MQRVSADLLAAANLHLLPCHQTLPSVIVLAVITSTYEDWMTLACAAEPRLNDPVCLKL